MISKNEKRNRRHARIRARVFGTSDKPRLSVFKSNTAIYAQLIDDVAGKTIAAASSEKAKKGKPMTVRALETGKSIASKAKEKKISKVVFDRGGYRYTGAIEKLAAGAREGGLIF